MKPRLFILIALIGLLGFGFNAYIDAEDVHEHAETKKEKHDAPNGHEAHGAQEEHDGQGENEAHGHHDEDVVRLSPEAQKAFGIEVGVVGAGQLDVLVSLQGEVVVNPDRFAHIVPRVSGVVRSVHKNLGDAVEPGDVMAVLESRELSDVKSAFLAAKERERLALATFQRENRLWTDGISSEREYLDAKQKLAESQIEAHSAEHKLHALGFSDAYLKTLPNQPDVSYTKYDITAPFEGVVVAKHITLGENLKDDAEVFSVADLRSVWVMLTVYQKDLPYLQLGDEVRVTTQEGGLSAVGKISYISPIIDESTRTATARVVLDNEDGRWRPGLFVNGEIETGQKQVAMLVPKTALQNVENRPCVFVLTPEGFEPQAVGVGRSTQHDVEILEGLTVGQRYVAKGAFTLKAQLEKDAFGDGHNH